MLAGVKDAYAKAFTLRGRLGRRDFVHYLIFAYAVWLMLWAIVPGPKFSLSNPLLVFDPFAMFSTVGQIKAITLLLISVPVVSLYARRLHDLGFSAGWAFVLLLVEMIMPLSSLVADGVLAYLKGSPEANDYGPGARKVTRKIRLDDSGRRP